MVSYLGIIKFCQIENLELWYIVETKGKLATAIWGRPFEQPTHSGRRPTSVVTWTNGCRSTVNHFETCFDPKSDRSRQNSDHLDRRFMCVPFGWHPNPLPAETVWDVTCTTVRPDVRGASIFNRRNSTSAARRIIFIVWIWFQRGSLSVRRTFHCPPCLSLTPLEIRHLSVVSVSVVKFWSQPFFASWMCFSCGHFCVWSLYVYWHILL